MSDASLSSLIPRLYPFLSHGIDTVRGSCLNTINNLIINGGDKSSAWLGIVLDELLNKLFIRLVLEGDSNVGNLTYQVSCLSLSLPLPSFLFLILFFILLPPLGMGEGYIINWWCSIVNSINITSHAMAINISNTFDCVYRSFTTGECVCILQSFFYKLLFFIVWHNTRSVSWWLCWSWIGSS